jgi:hypothetical protein
MSDNKQDSENSINQEVAAKVAALTESTRSPNDGKLAPVPIFNLEELRLKQDFGAGSLVKKALLTVPVRKPNKQDFIRTRPGEEWQAPLALIELKEDREVYVVTPNLVGELSDEAVAKLIVTAVNRQGVPFLWPIRLPSEDGRHDAWNRSAMEAANIAARQWVRVSANMSLGAYDVFTAQAEMPEPVWPDVPLSELVRIAFKGRVIDTLEHPVVRRLRGEL